MEKCLSSNCAASGRKESESQKTWLLTFYMMTVGETKVKNSLQDFQLIWSINWSTRSDAHRIIWTVYKEVVFSFLFFFNYFKPFLRERLDIHRSWCILYTIHYCPIEPHESSSTGLIIIIIIMSTSVLQCHQTTSVGVVPLKLGS